MNKIFKSILFTYLLLIIIILSFPLAKAHASTLFSDSFTDTNGTTLDAHDATWVKGGSEFNDVIIQSNKARILGGNNTMYYVDNHFLQEDQCISADIDFPLSTFIALFARRNETRSAYYYYAIDPGGSSGILSQNGALASSTNSTTTGTHNMKICAVGTSIKAYFDNIQVMNATDSTNTAGTAEVSTGNIGGGTFDNFLFTNGDQTIPFLNVPLFKQTNPMWSSLIYDSANKWSSKDASISSWGCALTSAAMVLNYHGIFKLPSSAFITPGTLNTWLNNEKDGYVRNGLVNWLAISRLSKLAKQSNYNENFHFDALEFSRMEDTSKTQLKADIANGIPVILEEPGHYIVAKGKTDTSFLINDPFYNRIILSDGYQNSYISLNRFVPSNTDLSYFMLVGDNNLSLKLFDKNNILTGDVFTQHPIQSTTNGQKGGPDFIELLTKNPETGNYILTTSSNTLSLYTLDFYLYDSNGIPFIKTINGLIDKDKTNTFLIKYDHNNSNKISIKKNVIYSTLIDDITEAISLKKIDKNLGLNLITQIKLAEKFQPTIKSQSKTILKAVQQMLIASNGSLIKSDAFSILSEDVTSLISTL